MNPLGTVALGLVLVLADLRISGFDVLSDAVGWLVAVSGLSRLTGIDRVFGPSTRVAVLAGVLSLADLVHPQRTTTSDGGSSTTTSVVPPDGLQGVLVSLYDLATAVAVVLLSLALRDRARSYGQRALARRFGTFALLHALFDGVALVLAVVALSVGAQGRITPEGPLVVLTLLFVLAGVGLQVWFLVVLAGTRTQPWLQPAVGDAPQD